MSYEVAIKYTIGGNVHGRHTYFLNSTVKGERLEAVAAQKAIAFIKRVSKCDPSIVKIDELRISG